MRINELTEGGATRCIARCKVCRNPTGCGYRYPRKSPDTACPLCGYERRCKNAAAGGSTVCRMHGWDKARRQSGKYVIARKMEQAYNRIMEWEDMLSLAQERGIVGARIDFLMQVLDGVDNMAAVGTVKSGADMIEVGALTGEMRQIHRGLQLVREGLDPLAREQMAADDMTRQIEIMRRLTETEAKVLALDVRMIPVEQVYEFLVYVEKLVIQFIPNSEDRSRFYERIRRLHPQGGKILEGKARTLPAGQSGHP